MTESQPASMPVPDEAQPDNTVGVHPVSEHLTDEQLRPAMEALFKERNRLARQVADLQDEMASLSEEYAESQRKMLIERARLQVAAGGTEDSISDEAREDGENIAQIVLDKVWHDGYLDALHHAFDLLHSEQIIATRQGWRNYTPSKLTETSVPDGSGPAEPGERQ